MGALLRAVPTRFHAAPLTRGHGARDRVSWRGHPLFSVRLCPPYEESLFLVVSFLLFSTPLLSLFAFPICHPDEGWRSADSRPGAAAPGAGNDAAGQAPGGVPASLNGGRRASRRSTVAILGRGPRFPLRHFLRIRAASSSQPGHSAWRAGPRTSRACGCEPQPRDATPSSA